MQRETIEYQDGMQKLRSILFRGAEVKKESPAVIVFPAFEGLAPFALQYAQTIAEQGYVVLAADVYGDGKTSDTIDGCMQLLGPFLQDRALTRRRACLAHTALSQQKGVDKQRIGAVGFCFGGMCVLEGARSGIDLRVGVTMHGVLAKSELPTKSVKSKLLLLQGYQDKMVGPENLTAFAKEMKEVGAEDWTFTYFGDAQHSFTDPRTGTFNPKQEAEMGRVYHAVVADQAWRYMLDFFKNYL